MSFDKNPEPVLPATYPIRLRFDAVSKESLRDAAAAVYDEYEAASRWKRLHAESVRPLTERNDETVFVLKIDHVANLDWTLEGADAFKPLRFDEIGLQESYVEDSTVWSGKIIEFDEAGGELYVDVFHPKRKPRKGDFIVKPFEFLRTLNEVFNGESFRGRGFAEESGEEFSLRKRLAERLAAAVGNAPYAVDGTMTFRFDRLQERLDRFGVRPDDLKNWWSRSWAILWGPPGTGKTYTTGALVASVLADEPRLYEGELPPERILVVSTTNQAVDSVAVSTGKAARKLHLKALDEARLVRIGKGCRIGVFEENDLLPMLEGTDTGLLREIQARIREIDKTTDPEERAMLRKEIVELRGIMRDAARRHFLDANRRVVFCTAFAATQMLCDCDVKDGLDRGKAPFTTVVIDEAGLIPRTTTAALSLLASRRVILVGDSKQLSPISKISRIKQPNKAKWIASSGLDHLETISLDALPENVQFLKTQYRMHPEIGELISNYRYEGKLRHDDSTRNRAFPLHRTLLGSPPRAVWDVLDEEKLEAPQIRAERGPGHRSWIRRGTIRLLEKMFDDEKLASMNGLFISPYVAQAHEVRRFFARKSLDNWTASTVHCQQGQEADVVIFDTVCAGSHGWPRSEWMRMINVALSRAREMVLVLASQDEMSEAFLAPLLGYLRPCIHEMRSRELSWLDVPAKIRIEESETLDLTPESLGAQILERKKLHPVLSQEQQRLCGYKIDGKPRLVRGVAGSGKTAVLAEWLVKTLETDGKNSSVSELPIWVVYANTALEDLLRRAVDDAWKKHCFERDRDPRTFPEKKVEFWHIHRVIEALAKEEKIAPMERNDYDYDKKAAEILEAVRPRPVLPYCRALFLDESQDMGPHVLELLFSLVENSSEKPDAQTETAQNTTADKSVCIFYDNAQNVYNRKTPNWKRLGLDMRGRATVMKESFRSTKVISEYAINTLYRLKPDELGDDHKELMKLGLLVPIQRNEKQWWSVRFNQIDGPIPELSLFSRREDEFHSLADNIVHLIDEERVPAAEIRVIANGLSRFSEDGKLFEKIVSPIFRKNRIDLLIGSKRFRNDSRRTVVVTTPHSFKGFDAEVVFIPAVDRFVAGTDRQILANPLYVAMTRARSLLKISGNRRLSGPGWQICDVLQNCLDILKTPPDIDETDLTPPTEIVDKLASFLGEQHRDWIEKLQRHFEIVRDPICDESGDILAEPLFFLNVKPQTYACFGPSEPNEETLRQLEGKGIKLLRPGESFF